MPGAAPVAGTSKAASAASLPMMWAGSLLSFGKEAVMPVSQHTPEQLSELTLG